MQKRMFLLFFSFYCFSSFAGAVSFTRTATGKSIIHNEEKIVCYCDQQKVGFAYSVKCIFGLCVIHSLYVYPRQRCNGYGSELVKYVCSSLRKNGGKSIYIQPGPFELTNGGAYKEIDVSQYQSNIQKLVNFYKRCEFKKASSITSFFAQLMYKLALIDEDASYLMVNQLKG